MAASAPKESSSLLVNGDFSEQCTSENLSDLIVPGKTEIENACGSERQNVSESVVTDVTPVINTDDTEASQALCSTDYDESLGEINEDLSVSSRSKLVETEKESKCLSNNDENFDTENLETSHRKIFTNLQACDHETSKCEKTTAKRQRNKDITEISQEERRGSEKKDQCSQANFSLQDAKIDEVKILKEKLAISKKDTETMQKLLEDVRKDYEELQKGFEKRESETKIKESEALMKESDETRKQKTERKRGKTSKRDNKVSSSDEKTDSRFSERRKTNLTRESSNAFEGNDTGEIACPCLVQSVRNIITDVREDFNDTILVFKQSSEEHCANIGKELVKLKREYTCAVERKESEIHGFENIIKGLQSRLQDSEREAATFRSAISSAYEQKQKLYDDIRLLKDELLRTKYEKEASQADVVKMKQGLKKYCTAEEYEELQKLNFKFSSECGCSDTDDCGKSSEHKVDNDDVNELRNKVAKLHPVLKKAKKEITKLKEEKQDAENRLAEKISEAADVESYLNKQLSEALMGVKQKERGITELKEQLACIEVENAMLNTKINQLEKEEEDLGEKHKQELEAVQSKLKTSNESLELHKVKGERLQQENDLLNDGYLGLKKYLEGEKAKVLAEMTESSEYLSDDEDSAAHQLLKNESLLKKHLEAEKERNELCLKEIENLKKELDQWKGMVRDDMDLGLGFLRIENEDLKDELQENQVLIKELVSKKKLHVQIIKKLRAENALLKSSNDTVTDEYEDVSFDSDDEMDSGEPGYDRTTTQEHRVRFDKNGKIEKPECSDDEDLLFDVIKHGVHFPEENNDLHNDSSLEILEYDTSMSEKE